jgi:hypothetical protein
MGVLAGWLSHGVDVQPVRALDCNGEPPKLVNKDDIAYDYSIKCAKKTETGSIPAGSSKKLKKKAGCVITVGDNKATKLHSEMVCTIENAELTCELL